MEIPIIKVYKKNSWKERMDKVMEAYFKSTVYGESILVMYEDD